MKETKRLLYKKTNKDIRWILAQLCHVQYCMTNKLQGSLKGFHAIANLLGKGCWTNGLHRFVWCVHIYIIMYLFKRRSANEVKYQWRISFDSDKWRQLVKGQNMLIELNSWAVRELLLLILIYHKINWRVINLFF